MYYKIHTSMNPAFYRLKFNSMLNATKTKYRPRCPNICDTSIGCYGNTVCSWTITCIGKNAKQAARNDTKPGQMPADAPQMNIITNLNTEFRIFVLINS